MQIEIDRIKVGSFLNMNGGDFNSLSASGDFCHLLVIFSNCLNPE